MSSHLINSCNSIFARILLDHGVDLNDKETWTQLVVRFDMPDNYAAIIEAGAFYRSHFDVACRLLPFAQGGCVPEAVIQDVVANANMLPRAYVTGEAEDIYLCHPFLVHRAWLSLRSDNISLLPSRVHIMFALLKRLSYAPLGRCWPTTTRS